MSWEEYGFGTSDSPVAGGPSGQIRKIELFINEQWIDITSYVYSRDAISITRGRSSEAAGLERSACRLTINNRDGRFSPRNPIGPYYGKIGRNTPLRVSVSQGDIIRYRFYGEVSDWPQKWDISGRDVYVQIEASGITRRLEQGSTPLHSTMYRGLLFETTVPLVAYWPAEDDSRSVQIASAISNYPAMLITGTPELSSNAEFLAATALPVMGSASFKGIVPSYTNTNEIYVRFLMKQPAAGLGATRTIAKVTTRGGTAAYWELYGGATSALGLRGFDIGGANIADTTLVTFKTAGKLLRVSIELKPNGTSVNYAIVTVEVGATTGFIYTGTLTSATVGRAASVQIAPNKDLTDVVIGHISVQSDWIDMFNLTEELEAYEGETAGTRFRRLCREEGIQHYIIGDINNTAAMGPQTSDTLLNLLKECADVDLGLLYETKETIGLSYKTRESLYNQSAKLTLSHANHELSDSLSPVDDDQLIRNDVTVERSRGSFARSVLEEGSLSIQAPPNGVGRYDELVTINIEKDGDLSDQASWRVRLGTVDESRYPAISVNLRHSTFTNNESLKSAVLTADVGDRLIITNPPVWLPPDNISQFIQGYSETLGNLEHDIIFNCSPESPYRVAVLDNAELGRADTAGSELSASVNSTAASISVTTTSGPVWVTDSTEFPFNLIIGGEVITVTAITGASSPQTFTVTRSVNGVVKSHLAGTDVSLAQPSFLAL